MIGVRNFRMKQQRIQVAIRSFHRHDRRGRAGGRDGEAWRHGVDVIAMARPHAQRPSDQLRVLRPKIQYENGLVGHERAIIPQGIVPRRIHATILALVLLVTLVDRSVGLGAEPKKKFPPVPLPLLPAVQEWIATLDAPPSAGGAMDAERVYIPIQSEQLVALSRASGATLWRRDIESTWPPIVIGGTLYLAASDEIHALDSATGAEKWRVPFDGRMTA